MTKTTLAALLVLSMPLILPATAEPIYVGTYTRGESEGIYLLDFDVETGALALRGLAVETENPSFLAYHPEMKVVYAVGEMPGQGGRVSAFAVDPVTNMLSPLGRQSSGGGGPCHVALSPTGGHLAVANYGGGNVSVLPILENGDVGPASDFVQHEGTGPNERRQEKPHAHGVTFDPTDTRLYVADLGADAVFAYDFDGEGGTIRPAAVAKTAATPGAGPRHFVFHPNGDFAYAVNELDSTVTAYRYDADTGALHALESKSTLPAEFEGENTTAEIAVHPNGRTLYASNRGHDSIATFSLDADGRLALQGTAPSGGKTPRFFGVHPSGRYLFAANQNSGNIVVFAIHADTSALTPTEAEVLVDSPVCLVFPGEN